MSTITCIVSRCPYNEKQACRRPYVHISDRGYCMQLYLADGRQNPHALEPVSEAAKTDKELVENL